MSEARVGVDVGGTFTDAVLMDDETGDHPHQGADDRRRPVRGDAGGAAAAGRRPRLGVVLPPRVHGRAQRGADPHRRQDRDARHRRPPRPARQRPRLAPVRREPLRPDLAAPARGAPDRRAAPPPRGPRADARERRGPARARRGGDPARARVPQARRGSRRSASASSTPTSTRAHEQRVRELVDEVIPDAYVQTSAIWPLAREFERTFVVMLDAYTGPPVVRYSARLEERLEEAGFDTRVEIMQMDGGLRTSASRSARRRSTRCSPGRSPACSAPRSTRASCSTAATSSASTSAAPAPTSA